MQPIAFNELAEQLLQVFRLRLLNAFVDDVGGALLHAELVDFPEELGDHVLALVGLPVVEALLDGIVPVGVLCQLNRMLDDFGHQLLPIIHLEGLGNEELDHAEAVVIHGELDEAVENLIEDKLTLVLLKTFDECLDHMGALHILL